MYWNVTRAGVDGVPESVIVKLHKPAFAVTVTRPPYGCVPSNAQLDTGNPTLPTELGKVTVICAPTPML